ncbi:unnamed protein product [Rotaria sp. Silwood2]|nr:unnamed protein product [Rotaria sp. Silwood2]
MMTWLPHDSQKTIDDFFHCCPKHLCISEVTWRTDLFTKRDYHKTLLTDFIGNVRRTEIVKLDNQLLDNIFINTTINQSFNKQDESKQEYAYISQMPI